MAPRATAARSSSVSAREAIALRAPSPALARGGARLRVSLRHGPAGAAAGFSRAALDAAGVHLAAPRAGLRPLDPGPVRGRSEGFEVRALTDPPGPG